MVLAMSIVLLGSPAGPSYFAVPSPTYGALSAILYSALAGTYFILFSAIETDSPTLSLLQVVYQHRAHGIGREELLAAIAKRSYIQARIDQMLSDGMATRVGERLMPAKSGRNLLALVMSYRRLLGLSAPRG